MRRLKGAVPRAFNDHRTHEAKAYSLVVTALIEQLGKMPSCGRPLVREYGRVVIELERNALEMERATSRRRLTDARRLRREAKVLRFTMLKLDQRLQQLAGSKDHGRDALADLLREDEGT